MVGRLPIDQIRFCTPEEQDDIELEFLVNQGVNLQPDSEIGYALEVRRSYAMLLENPKIGV